MKKYIFIIVGLVGCLIWQQYAHKQQINTLKNAHEQEVAELQDMFADACNDAIIDAQNEILSQF